MLSIESGTLSCSVCEGYALKCHTCVASNEDDCNRQGSTSCPQYADACSTITGPSKYTHRHSIKAQVWSEWISLEVSTAQLMCCVWGRQYSSFHVFIDKEVFLYWIYYSPLIFCYAIMTFNVLFFTLAVWQIRHLRSSSLSSAHNKLQFSLCLCVCVRHCDEVLYIQSLLRQGSQREHWSQDGVLLWWWLQRAPQESQPRDTPQQCMDHGLQSNPANLSPAASYGLLVRSELLLSTSTCTATAVIYDLKLSHVSVVQWRSCVPQTWAAFEQLSFLVLFFIWWHVHISDDEKQPERICGEKNTCV